jgi:hypothetical protein
MYLNHLKWTHSTGIETLGMTIYSYSVGPIKIPIMGRVKTRILSMDMDMGNYPQNWTGMGAGTGILVPTPYTHMIYIYLF